MECRKKEGGVVARLSPDLVKNIVESQSSRATIMEEEEEEETGCKLSMSTFGRGLPVVELTRAVEIIDMLRSTQSRCFFFLVTLQ